MKTIDSPPFFVPTGPRLKDGYFYCFHYEYPVNDFGVLQITSPKISKRYSYDRRHWFETLDDVVLHQMTGLNPPKRKN